MFRKLLAALPAHSEWINFLSIVISIAFIVTLIICGRINAHGYMANYSVVMRLIIYSVLVFVTVAFLTTKIKIDKQLLGWFFFGLFNLLISVALFIKTVNNLAWISLSLKYSAFILTIYLYQGVIYFSLKYNYKYTRYASLAFMLIAALMLLTTSKYLNSESYLDKVEISNIKKTVFIDNGHLTNLSPIQAQLQINLTRGGFFHHYQSIARTIFVANGPLDYFSNQYGFGPLYSTQLLSKFLNMPLFDAIYLNTILGNILVALCILFGFLYKKTIEPWIAIGYMLSILLTYSLSNVMAPFLYFTRFLPTVLLCLYVYFTDSKSPLSFNEPKFSRLNWKYLLIYFVIALYNFEFAILSFTALFIHGLYIRKYSQTLCAAAFSVVALFFKAASDGLTTENATNYWAYFSGNGMSGGFHPISAIYVLGIFYFFIQLLFQKNRFETMQSYSLLVCITFFTSLKLIWNGSPNHISALALMLACCIAMRVKNQSKTILSHNETLTYQYGYFLTICFAIASLSSFSLNKKYPYDSYVRSEISNIFYLPQSYLDLLEEYRKIYIDNSITISPVDNALSLYVKKQITWPFPDYSTNLNYAVDIYIATDGIKTKKPLKIYVDKEILNNQEELFNLVADIIKLKTSNNLSGISQYKDIYEYQKNIKMLRTLFKNVLSMGYSSCGSTEHFKIYCIQRSI